MPDMNWFGLGNTVDDQMMVALIDPELVLEAALKDARHLNNTQEDSKLPTMSTATLISGILQELTIEENKIFQHVFSIGTSIAASSFSIPNLENPNTSDWYWGIFSVDAIMQTLGSTTSSIVSLPDTDFRDSVNKAAINANLALQSGSLYVAHIARVGISKVNFDVGVQSMKQITSVFASLFLLGEQLRENPSQN